MKKIGFIDFYISEWHANNYPVWIKQICERTGADFEVGYVWAEQDVSPVDGRTTDQWCAQFGAERCATIDELCEKSDYILILAPSDPDKHLGYAREALKCGKNTYIDKTFAPDHATAKEIFDIAQQYGTKFFSSSALRYATELDGLEGALDVATTGGGSSIEEYIIHQAEMVVRMTDASPVEVSVKPTGDGYICDVALEGGKHAVMTYGPSLPFAIEADGVKKGIGSDFFIALLEDILRFYNDGVASFDIQQTLKVMKLREAVIAAKNAL